MKNGFHENALFTISLQTQVSLRFNMPSIDMPMPFTAELTAVNANFWIKKVATFFSFLF